MAQHGMAGASREGLRMRIGNPGPRTRWLLAVLLLGAACSAPLPTNPPAAAGTRGGVTFVRARCASASSCLLGQVVTAETAAPLPHATVFLEREEGGEAVEITTLTDDQGVFAIVEPPAGRYRLQVFKRERRLEVHGLSLGEPGTTMVPVRLPQG